MDIAKVRLNKNCANSLAVQPNGPEDIQFVSSKAAFPVSILRKGSQAVRTISDVGHKTLSLGIVGCGRDYVGSFSHHPQCSSCRIGVGESEGADGIRSYRIGNGRQLA